MSESAASRADAALEALASGAGSFAFATTSPGSEAWLKREVARSHPSLRPAFGRPGLVTFKATASTLSADFALESAFARSSGAAIGSLGDEAAIAELAQRAAQRLGAPLVLAVAPRVAGAWAELDASAHAQASAVADALADRARGALTRALPHPGQRVFDVFIAPGEPSFVGLHTHTASRAPHPGGLLPAALPPAAPSRAYLKLAEAVLRFGLDLRAGESALELGSAPGGISLALVERGIEVLGVDPGAMDPRVEAAARAAREAAQRGSFRHLAEPVGALKRADLPRPLHWIVSDMNLAPRVVLRYVERAVGPSRGTLLGAIVTLKLNEPAMIDELPELAERLRSMGFARVRLAQLPSNRQELCALATTDRGEARTGRFPLD
jgi:23S rRNA (cytidine2498-2'-O)-methyltransferase